MDRVQVVAVIVEGLWDGVVHVLSCLVGIRLEFGRSTSLALFPWRALVGLGVGKESDS